jgi:hypothetical protein
MEIIRNQFDWDSLPTSVTSVTIDSNPDHTLHINVNCSSRSIFIKNDSKVIAQGRIKRISPYRPYQNPYIKALNDFYTTFTGGTDSLYMNEIMVCDTACCIAKGNTLIKANDSSTIFAYDESSVIAYDKASVESNDSASIDAHDKSHIRAYGTSSITAGRFIVDEVLVEVYSASVKLSAMNNTKIYRRYYVDATKKFLLF